MWLDFSSINFLKNGITEPLELITLPYLTTERIVSKISRELEELGQSEIQSSIIGRKVMEELKELDKIAYIMSSTISNSSTVDRFLQI